MITPKDIMKKIQKRWTIDGPIDQLLKECCKREQKTEIDMIHRMIKNYAYTLYSLTQEFPENQKKITEFG